MPGTRKVKTYTHFTEVSKKSCCSQSQTGFLCSAVAQVVCTAFLGMVLLTELVLSKEFSVLSAGSWVYGSKKCTLWTLWSHL